MWMVAERASEGGVSSDSLLAASHRAILRFAVVLLPAVLAAEWVLEALDDDARLVPRWYVYLFFWLIAWRLCHRARPNALVVLMPAVTYLSVGTVIEATTSVDSGVPDMSTTLALLVGLGIVSGVLAYERTAPAVGFTTAAVAVVAVVTGDADGLAADDLIIRVVTPVLMVSLAGWMISRLRRDLDRKAEDLSRLVGARDRLVAAVSHELRTPLTGVVGFSDELASNWDRYAPVESKQLVGVIADQAHDMADIIEDLLVAARVDTGDVAVVPSTVDLRSEVDRIVATGEGAQLLASGRVRVSGGGVLAWADPLRCRQIIRNLLTNASRYGGNEIAVRVFLAQGRACVSVSDNGRSLTQQQADRLFEPYYTAHDDVAAVGSVGLGLPVSRQLARLMGGDLTCQIDGAGTTFRLDLSCAEQ